MNVRITKDTLLQELSHAVPGFKPDPESVEEPLLYLIINDFARYICDESENRGDQVSQAIEFLEQALEGQDSYVRDLVYECLETLSSCQRIPEIKKRFGNRTRGLWNEWFEKQNGS